MNRVYNFSAGPSMMPESVLKKAAEEMLNYNGSGQSVMEMSHRSPVYDAIIKETEALFRKTLSVPDNYKVLFLQGGASSQFSAIPLNFMNGSGKADYIISGQFSKKAFKEAQKYGDVKAIASSEDATFSYIPKITREDIRPDADYVYVCYNNTIFGTCFPEIPDTGDIPLIADMSSCILSTPIDVSKFAVIYGGAQKNMGPAGLTVVIIREDMLGKARAITPVMMDYAVQAENDSMYNTPPTYAIYIHKLILEWVNNEIGGIENMEKVNREKAAILYDYLDSCKLFKPTAKKEDRSIMNVCFVTGDKELDALFCKEAAAAGFVNIKGHRSVGGMRASIYNAMPTEGVKKLVEFMKEFEAKHQ
ncbi:MAG: 3-phosphoserine/phosphohydroxythreonine transaminase [Oscillospiraceae bacterium]|nr:3-phosphoserine/phosphohydroxythreonine transaminase [Oscillospiraceae bacterium]